VTGIDADIDALKGLHDALARFRHAQQDVADRADDAIELARASLEAKASRWRSQLEQARAELDACRYRAGQAAAGDGPVDCSGYARAVDEAGERLERIRRWQQRVDQEASEFHGIASRFRSLLEDDLPRTRDYLLAMVASLEAARHLQAPGRRARGSQPSGSRAQAPGS
jgi:hypothetical protein